MRQKRIYQFGSFCIDPVNHLLLRDGEPLPLQPKSFEMLCVLVEQRGQVVNKDSLLKRLWPDAIVEEANLTQNVYLLRKLLGQGGERPYIETVPISTKVKRATQLTGRLPRSDFHQLAGSSVVPTWLTSDGSGRALRRSARPDTRPSRRALPRLFQPTGYAPSTSAKASATRSL